MILRKPFIKSFLQKLYFIRFAIDWLEMVEIENDDFSIVEGDWISFAAPCAKIGIFPY